MLIDQLLAAGATVCATDPVAMEAVRKQLGDRIEYEESNYDCAKGADALVLVTEWHEFRRPSFERLKSLHEAAGALRRPQHLEPRPSCAPPASRTTAWAAFDPTGDGSLPLASPGPPRSARRSRAALALSPARLRFVDRLRGA